MRPPVYHALKARLLPLLQPLYAHVAVPREAPDKLDHGDIDFVVTGPRAGLTHQTVMEALRAKYSVPPEGGQITNFAVPMLEFDLGATNKPDAADNAENSFYQVDVNVSADLPSLRRLLFFNSYGDLGIIFGLLAQSLGLSLGSHGLRLDKSIATNPPSTFYLSSSMTDILDFFGLAMARWEEGFSTQRSIFDWVATSPYFDAFILAKYDTVRTRRNKKAREERTMYQDFVAYARERIQTAPRGHRKRPTLLGASAARAKRLHCDSSGKTLWSRVTEPMSTELAEPLPWELALFDMSLEQVQALVKQVKDEMQEQGKLEFDWRAAKALKEEQKRLKAEQNSTADA
ncbi:hypothetical protein A0H81_08338 [Grifola frondosa]|uniref:Uncharacterized protein n=1 Tax=Grifola frondosa TaxID=5627 RepID=A0A1C7M303_GRIFR|nr:hypothetical protein A0H81_08338 [Grifola frondosa]